MHYADGGDQNNDSILKYSILEKIDIALIDGLEGEIESSSWLLKKT